MKKTKLSAELIEGFGTFTVKVYRPTQPNCSDEKYYFTANSKKQALLKAKKRFSTSCYSIQLI